MKQGRANRIFPREYIGHSKYPLPMTQETALQMVNTKIKLIMFFVVEDGEAVYSQRKQDMELTVVQIISFSQQNLGLN